LHLLASNEARIKLIINTSMPFERLLCLVTGIDTLQLAIWGSGCTIKHPFEKCLLH
jgi:hypothetical protein